jgi:hypothetical protein
MKRVLLIAAMAISSIGFSQSGLKEDMDILQSVYGKEKKDLVAAYMALAEPQAAAFWTVYDQYEAERKKLGMKRVELLNDYATHFETLTDAKADSLAKAMLGNNMEYEKLYSKYYEKAKKIIGALNAAKFLQLEIALQTVIKSETQNAIPFIGEMDRTKKS